MFLSLAFVPPQEVLDHLDAYLGLPDESVDGLDVVPPAERHMSMTAFGNVSRGEVPRLAEALRRASEGWPPTPTIRLAGGKALEWPGDTSVWVASRGDVAALNDVARTIAPTVDRLGFAVDRRRFHPWLPVARVTAQTELSSLERLVGRLEEYVGPAWVADRLSLLRTTFVPGRPSERGYEAVREFALPDA